MVDQSEGLRDQPESLEVSQRVWKVSQSVWKPAGESGRSISDEKGQPGGGVGCRKNGKQEFPCVELKVIVPFGAVAHKY